MISLSPDQALAEDALLAALVAGERVLCLTGPGGSGKTTLVKSLIRRLREAGWGVKLLAPTGKAALRLAEVTGEPTATIHSTIYGRVTEGADGQPLFSDPRAPCAEKTVVLIDEASMVDEALHREVLRQLPRSAALCYVGDRHQLPPIYGSWGPDFDHPTAILSEIHRVAKENPLIGVSAGVRLGGKLPHGEIGTAYARKSGDLLTVVEAYLEEREQGRDVVVLAWTNAIRQRFNHHARKRLERKAPFCPGDRLIVLQNSHTMRRMNGEVMVVEQANRWVELPEGLRAMNAPFSRIGTMEGECWWVKTACNARFWAHPDLVGVDTKDFRRAMATGLVSTSGAKWLHVDYGEALTVHRSQGSQFQTVFFLIDSATRFLANRDPATARRLTYTAATRAMERLVVWDL